MPGLHPQHDTFQHEWLLSCQIQHLLHLFRQCKLHKGVMAAIIAPDLNCQDFTHITEVLCQFGIADVVWDIANIDSPAFVLAHVSCGVRGRDYVLQDPLGWAPRTDRQHGLHKGNPCIKAIHA